MERIDVARHDRLQRRHQLGTGQHRIDAHMRHRRMASLAFDFELDLIRGRHQRTGADREGADSHPGNIMHAVDLIDRETIHQPILDHRFGAGASLFGRLKNYHGVAGEVTRFRQIARRPKKHCSVAIVTAGVHLARGFRPIRQTGFFVDRKSVHIRAQTKRPQALTLHRPAALDHADDAGAAEPGNHLVAPKFAQSIRHKRSRPVNVIHDLGMGMNVVAPGHDIGLQFGNTIDDWHRCIPNQIAYGDGSRASAYHGLMGRPISDMSQNRAE